MEEEENETVKAQKKEKEGESINPMLSQLARIGLSREIVCIGHSNHILPSIHLSTCSMYNQHWKRQQFPTPRPSDIFVFVIHTVPLQSFSWCFMLKYL